MRKALVLPVICMLCLTGCRQESIIENSIEIGSITNPYKGDGSEELEITCQDPNIGKESEIVINLKSLLFDDKFSVDDYYIVNCFAKLIEHSSEFPINLGDYISILYYDEDDQMVGENEYKFHYSETADKVGLAFTDIINEGWLDRSISYEEVNNAKLEKVAIQYFHSGKQKQVFFSLAPRIGSFEYPIDMDESGLYHVIHREEHEIDTRISNIVYSSKNGFSVQIDFKLYSYFNLVENHVMDGKVIDLNDYYSISYYDEQGIIGKSSYGLQMDQESSCMVQVGETVAVMSYISEEDLSDRIPIKIAFNYYSYGKERSIYVNIDKIQS